MAGRQITVLVDSGAGRNFLDAEFAERCGLRLTPNAFEVTLAGGQRTKSPGTYGGPFRLTGGEEGEERSIGGEAEFVVTPLRGTACDAVLGWPFLAQLNPRIDWRARTLSVRQGGKAAKVVKLRARGEALTITPGNAAPLSAIIAKVATHGELRRAVEEVVRRAVTRSLRARAESRSQAPLAAATAAQTPLHADDKRILEQLVGDFKDVFPDELPGGLPPSRGGIIHDIELVSGARPHKRPIYRMSESELRELKRQLDEMLAKGFIRHSKSPYAAPVMLVPKPDGGWRLVIDYRALNRDTIKNSYALPLADELFDRVQGAQVFSKIDLRTGFYQIPLKEEDCWKKPVLRSILENTCAPCTRSNSSSARGSA